MSVSRVVPGGPAHLVAAAFPAPLRVIKQPILNIKDFAGPVSPVFELSKAPRSGTGLFRLQTV
jgi:hypothetical protein